ncbi:MAG: enoyl-ACP reductase [Fimbriimonas ginsengisoli]|uniref:Enoyl-[acyl-carrier-protein] reductase [NADH] n=1 Tax=Fimbriimonas ginsengisoli TaxID=1005039 RepID=A0A931LRP8_FIMGI|nr:enoyl-ACP reductase [Fimbriimonas ginsengisoli]MBI3721676.1 enoyl-ACP reductase [Fimbriimonas ginsengisoli]
MLLEGKSGLVLNVTNKNSIGWAIADLANRHGATVGVGGQNERMLEGVRKLVEGRERFKTHQVDFQDDLEIDQLAEQVAAEYGKIDFLVHSAAFANRDDLAGRFIDTSREGFKLALEVSAYSLVRVCRALEPVLADDASVLTLSYLGSVRAVGNYNVMGVAKAALESSVRYLAVDLGVRGIRVNTLSPGPINTVAARGVKGLAEMIETVHQRAPLKRRFGQEEVAGAAVYLISDLGRGVTGQVIYVDSGYNILGF